MAGNGLLPVGTTVLRVYFAITTIVLAAVESRITSVTIKIPMIGLAILFPSK
jgi:hypothetical protein